MPKQPFPTLSDRELVENVVVDGDERAFRELYRRHTPRLYQLVMRLTECEPDAEDVVQETWIRATEAAANFRWESSFGTWLTGIAINRFRELLRKRNRWPALTLEQVAEPAGRPEGLSDRIDLEKALSLLPVGYRTVLVLHDLEGYRHEEIAEQLGIAAGTSKSQLFHARRYVRALLEPAQVQNEQRV
ncbi:MAG TPA: sigma-70 family RNA polymerase sigma factor [Longimicrobiales bacterium]|nr:sigma-70 family RNA polymerase sigma factor [Longimicrobiales bacterium]